MVYSSRSEYKQKLLEKCVGDCITYGLKEDQALVYIEKIYGKIGLTNYYHHKKRLESNETTDLWLNQFTRIGFVEKHRMLIEDAERVYKDSLNRYFVESIRNPPDKRLILRLEFSYRENGRYLAELMEGTPIIAAIKSQLTKQNEPIPTEEQKENGIREDNQESTTPVNRNGWV